MKHLRIESLIIALGLVCAGAFIYFGIEAFGERSRTVEVRGFSERIVEWERGYPSLFSFSVGLRPQNYKKIHSENYKSIAFIILKPIFL